MIKKELMLFCMPMCLCLIFGGLANELYYWALMGFIFVVIAYVTRKEWWDDGSD